jgi:hypothetical protein
MFWKLLWSATAAAILLWTPAKAAATINYIDVSFNYIITQVIPDSDDPSYQGLSCQGYCGIGSIEVSHWVPSVRDVIWYGGLNFASNIAYVDLTGGYFTGGQSLQEEDMSLQEGYRRVDIQFSWGQVDPGGFDGRGQVVVGGLGSGYYTDYYIGPASYYGEADYFTITNYTEILGSRDNFTNVYTYVYYTSTVPELSTWAMMLLGFAGLGFAGYRNTKNGRERLNLA